jgi:hypothetical protein
MRRQVPAHFFRALPKPPALKTKKEIQPVQSTTRIRQKSKQTRSRVTIGEGGEKPFSLPAHKMSRGADEEME